jgi:hypothetical protein
MIESKHKIKIMATCLDWRLIHLAEVNCLEEDREIDEFGPRSRDSVQERKIIKRKK